MTKGHCVPSVRALSFEYEMSPRGSRVWTFGPQLMMASWEVLKPLGNSFSTFLMLRPLFLHVEVHDLSTRKLFLLLLYNLILPLLWIVTQTFVLSPWSEVTLWSGGNPQGESCWFRRQSLAGGSESVLAKPVVVYHGLTSVFSSAVLTECDPLPSYPATGPSLPGQTASLLFEILNQKFI